MESRRERFRELMREKKTIDSTLAVLHWDIETTAPKMGQEHLSEMIGYLSLKSYEITTSREFIELLEFLREEENYLTEIEKKEIHELLDEVEKLRKIPPQEYKEYSELTASAQGIWAEAREKNDFKMFQEDLKKIFDYTIRFAKYRGGDENLYNIILDDYEKGMDIEKLDEFFAALKKEIVPLLKKIMERGVDYEALIKGEVSKEKQKEFSNFLAEYLGFDFNRGILAESAHPFTLTVNRDDVRITTRYIKDLPLSSVFSTIHESGHAIYEQGIDESLKDTVLCDGTSMGIHESQSRFYENIVGRSEEFWKKIYPEARKHYEYLNGVSFEDFIKGINSVQPSLIRVEADELTYSLHVMVRYEIEKGLFTGEFEVEKLPEIWNRKMEEYLGTVPVDDRVGVLQDVHWSCGLIGYFPSYALGNAYAAQLYHTMKKELDVEKILELGEMEKIKNWLHEKIHRYGKMKTPRELIKDITGEDLNPRYYIDYLKDKYSKVYGI